MPEIKPGPAGVLPLSSGPFPNSTSRLLNNLLLRPLAYHLHSPRVYLQPHRNKRAKKLVTYNHAMLYLCGRALQPTPENHPPPTPG